MARSKSNREIEKKTAGTPAVTREKESWVTQLRKAKVAKDPNPAPASAEQAKK